MKTLQFVADVYQNLQEHTKTLLRFCGSYLYAICLCAAALRICAGWWMEYSAAVFHSAELLAALRPCIGVTALGALLLEGIAQKNGS